MLSLSFPNVLNFSHVNYFPKYFSELFVFQIITNCLFRIKAFYLCILTVRKIMDIWLFIHFIPSECRDKVVTVVTWEKQYGGSFKIPTNYQLFSLL